MWEWFLSRVIPGLITGTVMASATAASHILLKRHIDRLHQQTAPTNETGDKSVNGYLTCFDTISNSAFPADGEAYAAYVDGDQGNQPNFSWVTAAFPKAEHMSITLFDNDADAADVETGAMTPAEVPAWHARQVARGIARPVIYASVLRMQDEILPVLTRAGISRGSTRLWTAHYGAGEHVCGPATCRLMSVSADGTQWTEFYGGQNLDASLLVPGFFAPPAAPPLPANWVYPRVRDLVVDSEGPTSVKLSWDAPSGPVALPGIGWYEIVVQLDGKDVASYPRVAPKGTNPETWQGGSLKPGTTYEASVRAIAQDGHHAGPWASQSFATAKA